MPTTSSVTEIVMSHNCSAAIAALKLAAAAVDTVFVITLHVVRSPAC